MATSYKHALIRQRILDAAVTFSVSQTYTALRRDAIAKTAGVAAGAVNYYFGSMEKLRYNVVRWAIDKNIRSVIRQAIVNDHPLAQKMGRSEKQSAMNATV